MVIGDTIYEKDNWMHPSGAFDIRTGAMITGGVKFSNGGCGRFTAISSGLLIGQAGLIRDIGTHRDIVDDNDKASCGTGQFVADGLLIKVAASCPGCNEWRGFFASRSMPDHATRPGARLVRGDAPAPHGAASDAADWPAYRDDGTRKGSSAAVVAPSAGIRWTVAPPPSHYSIGAGGEYLLPDAVATQPIAVGDRVWIGTAEGAVACLDRRTGAERWRTWTAGRIWSAPTGWQGRIYAGSCDGWVYCLDAETGQLAWRYRVAPEERRVMLLGHLASAWPIMASVLVEEGSVYAVGGMVGQFGGSQFCALDARTGAPRWEQHVGLSADGQLAWYRGQVWWHCGDAGVFVLDGATGAIHSPVNVGLSFYGSRGQDIGILPGGWVALGGRQTTLPLDRRDGSSISCLLRADPEGAPKDGKGGLLVAMTRLDHCHSFESIPVWDADETLLFGKPPGYQGGQGSSVNASVQPMWCKNLGATLTAEALARVAASAAPGGPAYKPEWFSGLALGAAQTRQATHNDYTAGQWFSMDAVMGSNAMVFCIGTVVYAVSRSDAHELWRVQLPTLAVMHGLSLSRSGDALVALQDGRVVCIGAPSAAATPAANGK